MADVVTGRRSRGLSQAKAKKIMHEGLSACGGGFCSEKQRGYIGLIAGGGMPTRQKTARRSYGKRQPVG